MIENSASPTWRGVGEPYWSRPAIEVLQECRSRPTGLTSTEARNGLSRHGPNTFADHWREQALAVLLRQFRNPLVPILIVAAIVSGVVGEGREAVIIGAIILASYGLGFRRARHGRATVPGLIEDARSAGHRQGTLPLSAGPEMEATEAHRR
ncbi:cation-transporting P-type ATPase [Mesorhizobium sp.]|uniref:cation-transporting P-type ATPase n=1 Tax=Mesorhizobium sp. TaxID=1871066 RepID=UPI0025DD7418|nr:cation-transporting P-type ATPase [Mesorhizobium sp.]